MSHLFMKPVTFFFFCALISLPPLTAYAETYTLFVTARPASHPLENVELKLNELDFDNKVTNSVTEKTNKEGEASFTNLKPGRYDLKASVAGYEEVSSPLIIDDSDVRKTIVLPSTTEYQVAFSISGTSEVVRLSGEERGQGLFFEENVSSQSTTLNLKEGDWIISAHVQGKLPVTLTLTVGPEQDQNGQYVPPVQPIQLHLDFSAEDVTPVTSERTLSCSILSLGGKLGGKKEEPMSSGSLPFSLILLLGLTVVGRVRKRRVSGQ